MNSSLNPQSLGWGRVENNIRALAAYAAARKAEIGSENVFDFSIGNPSVPPPECIEKAVRAVLEETDGVALHAYTAAPGLMSLRTAIARRLSESGTVPFDARQVYVTMGASSGLAAFCRAVLRPGEQAVVFAPYFMEYKAFAEANGSKFVLVPADLDKFQVNIPALAEAVNENTQAVILNSPNNPSGAILTEETLKAVAALLSERAKQYGHPIYIIADEPYRELVYDGAKVTFIPAVYRDTIVC